jgi:hypothetical protein
MTTYLKKMLGEFIQARPKNGPLSWASSLYWDSNWVASACTLVKASSAEESHLGQWTILPFVEGGA